MTKREHLHPLIEPSTEVDELATKVIHSAIEVHSILGPGYPESVYDTSFSVEMGLRGIVFHRHPAIPIEYKGHRVGNGVPDYVVDGRLVVELKAVDELCPVHVAQVRSYLLATKCHLGLVINFNTSVLLRGVRRVVLSTG